jgi:uncharacterized membrane protein
MTAQPQPPNAAVPVQPYERWIGRTLRTGVGLSTVLTLSGLVLASVQSVEVRIPERNPTFLELVRAVMNGALFHLDSSAALAMMYVGLVLLMLTPFLRVLATTVSFSVNREWRYVWVSLLVFAMLFGQLLYSLR